MNALEQAQNDYIKSEFRKHFPNANSITIANDWKTENIHVIVTQCKYDYYHTLYTFQIESDQDRFDFGKNSSDYTAEILKLTKSEKGPETITFDLFDDPDNLEERPTND